LLLINKEKFKGGSKMIQGVIIQGTTPEHEFTLPFDTSLIKELRISYGQKGREVIVKYDEDCTLDKDVIKVRLSQEDTFLFSSSSNVSVQIKVLTNSGIVHINEEEILLRVKSTLNSEVLS
jgi:hypothetical protein